MVFDNKRSVEEKSSMTTVRAVQSEKRIMGRLSHGVDLLEELTGICRRERITLGRVEALGALQKARVGYYNQESREYEFLTFDHHLEILNLIGNVSLKDGESIVHAHITLANSKGEAYGGHLASGTIVFACEYMLEACGGAVLERGLDEETGLPLWTD